MNEKELRTRLLEKAMDEIHDAVFEWGTGEDSYRDAVNYVQGVVTMVRAFDEILNE